MAPKSRYGAVCSNHALNPESVPVYTTGQGERVFLTLACPRPRSLSRLTGWQLAAGPASIPLRTGRYCRATPVTAAESACIPCAAPSRHHELLQAVCVRRSLRGVILTAPCRCASSCADARPSIVLRLLFHASNLASSSSTHLLPPTCRCDPADTLQRWTGDGSADGGWTARTIPTRFAEKVRASGATNIPSLKHD